MSTKQDEQQRRYYGQQIDQLRSVLYQRAYRIRKNPQASLKGVDIYDATMSDYKSRYAWFKPTGNIDYSKASIRELQHVTDRLQQLTALKTLTSYGAKHVNDFGEYVIKGYNNMTREEQSAIWRFADRIRDQYPDLTSDETRILIKAKTDAGSFKFGKDDNGILQVTSITDRSGNTFSLTPTGKERDMSEFMNKDDITFNETIEYQKYVYDKAQLLRKHAAKYSFQPVTD